MGRFEDLLLEEEIDLEARVHNDMDVYEPELAVTLEKSIKVKKTWRYQVEVFWDKVSNGARALGRGVKTTSRYLVYGGLPAQMQYDIEKKLGSEHYNPRNASMTNAIVTMPVIYGSLMIAIAYSPLPPIWIESLNVAIGCYGFLESLVRGIHAGVEDTAIGAPVYFLSVMIKSTVKASANKWRSFKGDWAKAVDEKRRRDLSGKYGS